MRERVRRLGFVVVQLSILCSLFGQSCAPTPAQVTPGPEGPMGPEGPAGPVGPAGADGQLRIYGDGSAGDLVVTQSANLLTLVPSGNLQFKSLTVQFGSILTVPSGTLIRCTNDVTISGGIQVQTGALGGHDEAAPHPGVSARAPGNGVATTGVNAASAVPGGVGLTADQAMLLLSCTPAAGGGGGGVWSGNTHRDGGAGGGQLVILAKGAIYTGFITAEGESISGTGAGGGGGGVIILASPTAISNTGVISARGGNGGIATHPIGGGGSGGGGIIHLISPSITPGTLDVSGGTNSGQTDSGGSVSARSSGGGGGACGGNGGAGGEVAVLAGIEFAQTGEAGTAGFSFQTLADPTALFR